MRFALFLVFCGVLTVCAGIWVLAGYGWALVVIGVCAAGFGLLLVDVDGNTKEKPQ